MKNQALIAAKASFLIFPSNRILMHPMWQMGPPRVARRRPRVPQEGPDSDPEDPRRRQDGPKRRPRRSENKKTLEMVTRRAQSFPRAAQEAPTSGPAL